MKKTISLLVSLFILLNIGIAQEVEERTSQHSFAVNIKSIIGLTDYGYFVSPSSPFAINYQYETNKLGIRASYGGRFQNSKRVSGQGNDVESKNSTNNVRLGVNYAVLEKGRFTARLGVDGAVLRTNSSYDSEWNGQRNYNKTTNANAGFGPVGILSFDITDFVSIAVESWYYIYNQNTTQEYTDGVSDIIYTDTTTGWSSELFEPSSVYLTVKF